MPSKTFEEIVESDLEPDILKWKIANPKVAILKKHPVERLPLKMHAPTPGKRATFQNQFSMRVDYEESS